MAPSASLRGFRSAAAYRSWLAKNHRTASELILRCYKTSAVLNGVTYRQALDEALCFGWIDGIRRAVDQVSFSVRFTPRRPRSIWSRVNVARVEELIAAGRMVKSGLDAYKARDEKRTGIYAFERAAMKLAPAYARRFRANQAAWSYFRDQAAWYQRTSIFWVMSAKREETRLRRLGDLIARSVQGISIRLLARPL